MIKEDWVKVKGVDGFFVSNLGRVKSSKGRVKCSKRDNITREIAETILKPIQYNNSNSSLFYHMRCKSGSVVLVRAEYLFYENFIGRRGFYSIISHKDGDVFNNKIDNLIENAHQDKMNERWKTLKENEKYEISCFGRVRSKIPEIKDDLYFGNYIAK